MATKKKKKTAGGSGTRKRSTSASNNGRTIIQIIGEWGKFQFYIKPSSIIGVKDLNISVSIETEDKKADNEHYVSRKGYQPAEVSMTGIFSATLGISDVKAKSWELMNIIRLGQKGYVYIGNDKLIAPMMMGVSAKTTDIVIGPNGKMIYCEVPTTMKQCEKYGGGTSGSSSGKKSSKKKKRGGTTTPKRDVPKADSERKKQLEQAKQTAKDRAAAKQQSAGYTPTRYTGAKTSGGAGGTWRAMTR